MMAIHITVQPNFSLLFSIQRNLEGKFRSNLFDSSVETNGCCQCAPVLFFTTLLSLSELLTTETELKAMAAAANSGLS